MILRIREAKVCGPHSLRLTFNNGTTKQVDVRPLLKGTIFEPLLDPAYFASVTLDSRCGTVVWPNGAGFRPGGPPRFGGRDHVRVRGLSCWFGSADTFCSGAVYALSLVTATSDVSKWRSI